MKYSTRFEEDYNWYLKWKDEFTFDGSPEEVIRKKIISDPKGKSAKECFYAMDSNGKILPCREPELLYQLYKCKGSINFNIKQWAESRASGDLPKILFSFNNSFPGEKLLRVLKLYGKEECDRMRSSDIEHQYELLPWMVEAVEKQKSKYYTALEAI